MSIQRTLIAKLVKPSTLRFWQEARRREHASFWEAIHGLVYLKWPEFYIGVGLGRGRASRLIREPLYRLGSLLGLWDKNAGARFADTYHGKAMPLPAITRLIRLNRPVRATLPEKVLPYSLARDIILDNPDALALLRCPCRATAANPCRPLDVCIIVGKPIVDFVLEHHPEKSRPITVEEAVDVVRAAQKRGNVSHAFFKEAVLGRYYAICNCCSCCCGAMQAHKSGTPMLASSGYIAEVSLQACTGCGLCAGACPFAAIDMRAITDCAGSKKTRKQPAIDPRICMGCGVCALKCPARALALRRDDTKPAPLILTEGGQPGPCEADRLLTAVEGPRASQ